MFHTEMTKNNQFDKPFSDETARLIDEEIRNLIDQQYQRALSYLEKTQRVGITCH